MLMIMLCNQKNTIAAILMYMEYEMIKEMIVLLLHQQKQARAT